MSALRKLLFPFSLLYGFIIRCRHWCYDKGLFTSSSFSFPVICVGNLSVGGTGKTPMVEYLIRVLQNNHSIATLSRGYKRTSRGFLVADERTTVKQLGDEPFQYFQKFPSVKVAVDANRVRGVSKLYSLYKPEVIILDDALQHRKIKAGLTILLTAYHKLYTDDVLLPAGDLRDIKGRARKANIIVVTKCPDSLTYEKRNEIVNKIAPEKHQELFFAGIRYADYLTNGTQKILLDNYRSLPFTLVTGIADPGPMVRFLENKKFSFQHKKYRDHHFFTKEDIAALNKLERVITTEKDFVRMGSLLKNCFYLPIETYFIDEKGGKRFNEKIEKYIKSKSAE
ncbi:tetraacyldisaccharide 4'-kinase [Ascidiimonas aurantiaca]|uniref:tetraacyldisaccharide 4'-kinase n=1 Tax=Ascidiimonas aurantiaca TaxID=1685432 RepID=UPI0030EC2DE7